MTVHHYRCCWSAGITSLVSIYSGPRPLVDINLIHTTIVALCLPVADWLAFFRVCHLLGQLRIKKSLIGKFDRKSYWLGRVGSCVCASATSANVGFWLVPSATREKRGIHDWRSLPQEPHSSCREHGVAGHSQGIYLMGNVRQCRLFSKCSRFSCSARLLLAHSQLLIPISRSMSVDRTLRLLIHKSSRWILSTDPTSKS